MENLFHRRDRRERRGNALVLLGALCGLCGGVLAENKQTVQTPFGPAVRQQKTETAPAKRGPDLSLLRAEEKGDTITFRRKTPFGDSVWTRKRSELSPIEKDILAAQASATKTPDKK